MAKKPNPPAPTEGDETGASASGRMAEDSVPTATSDKSNQADEASASKDKEASKSQGAAGDVSDSDAPQHQKDTKVTGTARAPADLLKQLLESYLATSTLQNDYQSLYRSLPAVVGIASEILKKKEAGDAALGEGMKAVEKVLGNARDKAEELSKAMADQQSALDQILQNKGSLLEFLKASQQPAPASARGKPQLSPEAAALSDPKVAYQLNTLMGNINSMVSREVERQLSGLRSQASQAAHPQQSPTPKQ